MKLLKKLIGMIKAIAHITVKDDPEAAVMYKIIPSADKVQKNGAGVYAPGTIKFNVYKIEGGTQTQVTTGIKMRVKSSNASGWQAPFDFAGTFSITGSVQWVDAQIFLSSNNTWSDKDILDSVHVPVMEDGQDAVQYWLETTDSIIHYDSAKVTGISQFTVTCKKKVGAGIAENCGDFRLFVDKYDGTTWMGLVPVFKNSSVSVTTNKIYTRYRVRAVNDINNTVCEINIEAVFDGAIGPAGAIGAIYFPRGEWVVTETYTKTDQVVQYVIFEGYAYEPKKVSVTGGNNPLADVQSGGANWKAMGRYDVVATRVLLANFAIIAGGVFWNNKLLSQWGVDNSGNATNAFTNYAENSGGVETGSFHPNVILDFLNGIAKFGAGKNIFNKDGSFALGANTFIYDVVSKIFKIGNTASGSHGDRIEFCPNGEDRIKIYDQYDHLITAISFSDSSVGQPAGGDYTVLGKITLNQYTRQGHYYQCLITPTGITLTNKRSGASFNINFTGTDVTNNLTVIAKGLPTSSTGLSSGQLWRNGNNISIVP